MLQLISNHESDRVDASDNTNTYLKRTDLDAITITHHNSLISELTKSNTSKKNEARVKQKEEVSNLKYELEVLKAEDLKLKSTDKDLSATENELVLETNSFRVLLTKIRRSGNTNAIVTSSVEGEGSYYIQKG